LHPRPTLDVHLERHVNIKLEEQRGGAVHTFDVATETTPPDVVFWDNRVFRYLRTDGVWDQKKHVYREATAHSLTDAGDKFVTPNGVPHITVPHLEAPREGADDEVEDIRKLNVSLTAKQAALLQQVRDAGGYASNKAAIIAGLEELEKASALSNEALLTLLAKRLRGMRG
jgi:hypothetical protein